MKKIQLIITGGTGFTGKFVVQKFIDEPAFEVSLLVRDEQKAAALGFCKTGVRIYTGSFEEQENLDRAFQDKEILVNIASLGFGHCPEILAAATKANISKAVFVSTTSVFTKLNPASKAIRLAAEKRIAECDIAYTIVRPTMIFGTKDDRNICRLIKYINKVPILPVAGPGSSLMQPVFVEDLASALYEIVKQDKFDSKAYNISGKTVCTFIELADMISKLLGKKIMKVHVPLRPMLSLFHLYEKISTSPKIKAEQLIRLNEDKAFSYEEASRDFGYAPLALEEVLRREIDDIFGQ